MKLDLTSSEVLLLERLLEAEHARRACLLPTTPPPAGMVDVLTPLVERSQHEIQMLNLKLGAAVASDAGMIAALSHGPSHLCASASPREN